MPRGGFREGRPSRCREAALRAHYRIRELMVASVLHRSGAPAACRRTYSPKPVDEAMSVLQRKHRLLAGTDSGRLTLRGDNLPLCLERAERGCHRILAIARTSVPHHERVHTAYRRTCAPRREDRAVSVRPRKVRLRDGSGSGNRKTPLDPPARLSHVSRAAGTVSVNPNVPAKAATVEHGRAVLRPSPVTAVL
jgi:hypothetical protein